MAQGIFHIFTIIKIFSALYKRCFPYMFCSVIQLLDITTKREKNITRKIGFNRESKSILILKIYWSLWLKIFFLSEYIEGKGTPFRATQVYLGLIDVYIYYTTYIHNTYNTVYVHYAMYIDIFYILPSSLYSPFPPFPIETKY